jgi:hypothetical protein
MVLPIALDRPYLTSYVQPCSPLPAVELCVNRLHDIAQRLSPAVWLDVMWLEEGFCPPLD